MAEHTDQELVRALVHDALMLCDGAAGDSEIRRIRGLLGLAEVLLADKASAEERASVYEVVHPSTRSHFLA